MYSLPVLSGPGQTHTKGKIYENYTVLLCVLAHMKSIKHVFMNELVVVKCLILQHELWTLVNLNCFSSAAHIFSNVLTWYSALHVFTSCYTSIYCTHVCWWRVSLSLCVCVCVCAISSRCQHSSWPSSSSSCKSSRSSSSICSTFRGKGCSPSSLDSPACQCTPSLRVST